MCSTHVFVASHLGLPRTRKTRVLDCDLGSKWKFRQRPAFPGSRKIKDMSEGTPVFQIHNTRFASSSCLRAELRWKLHEQLQRQEQLRRELPLDPDGERTGDKAGGDFLIFARYETNLEIHSFETDIETDMSQTQSQRQSQRFSYGHGSKLNHQGQVLVLASICQCSILGTYF